MKEKTIVIVNPISGTRTHKNLNSIIKDNLDDNKYDYEIIETKYSHHAIEIAKEFTSNSGKTLIICGGDGSINDCIQEGCIKKDSKIGIIPMGSGNGLTRHLEIPLNTIKAISVINTGKIKPIDSIKVNNLRYASIAGIGFDALVAYQFSKVNTRGFFSYLKICLENYPSYQPQKYLLEVDGHRIDTKALFISIANSNQFGYNTQIAPMAVLDDGLIDICIVKKIPLVSIPNTIRQLVQKKLDKSTYLHHFQAENIKIFNNTNKHINLDGETYDLEPNLNFEIIPKSLNIIIP